MTDPSNNLDDFPAFSCISRDAVGGMLEKLDELMEGYTDDIGVVGTIRFSAETLIEILDRIEKRRVYFHVFYKKCKMGELNEGALLSFWIAKLQPFYHIHPDDNLRKNSADLNAHIATYIFQKTICLYCERENERRIKEGKKKMKEREVPPHAVESLLYSFTYRDISKESLMLLAESLVDEKPE